MGAEGEGEGRGVEGRRIGGRWEVVLALTRASWGRNGERGPVRGRREVSGVVGGGEVVGGRGGGCGVEGGLEGLLVCEV